MCAQTAEELYARGVRLFEQGSPADALELLQKAVAAMPAHAASWKVMGVIYAFRGEYSDAEPNFAKACALEPRLADACFYHARSLYLLNRFQEALTRLEGLKSDSRRHRIQALCLDALGRWSEAEPLYRKAIESRAAGEDARVDYGIALARQGRAEEAVPVLELAIQMAREPARSELELGRVLLQLERLTAARTHLEKAVILAPASAQPHLLLGRLYRRLGMDAQAAEHLRLGAAATK